MANEAVASGRPVATSARGATPRFWEDVAEGEELPQVATDRCRLYMLANPSLLIFPVLALSLVVFASNLFGDAIRDELDPRLRTGR